MIPNLKTAECVSPKHPDKMCDQISDAILDECLRQDPDSRVAVETIGGHGRVIVMGEVTTKAHIPAKKITELVHGITGGSEQVEAYITDQSPEIAKGVDTGGAGDQGIMIGYACNETPELMPKEVMLSRSLNRFIFEKHPHDGKTQVTVDGKVVAIVASFQNIASTELKVLVEQWAQYHKIDYPVDIYCNPAGDWQQGGFDADVGLTGRKLCVDEYGPDIPLGGGAFSGKDPTKVDRSGAYMARRIAVDWLRSHDVKEVKVKLAYAIGKPEPLQATIHAVNQEGQPMEVQTITGYDLSPTGIIAGLNLKRPIYQMTARYGHFGNGFEWDK